MRQASSLGRIFRGALAQPDASLDAKGTGAPCAPTGSSSRWLTGLMLAIAVVGLMAAASAASAATVTQRPFLFSFDGSGTTAGSFHRAADEKASLAVDNSNGAVYVLEAGVGNTEEGFPNEVDKFHPDGTAWDFPALGASTLPEALPASGGVAVDNSSGPTQGRLLLTEFGQTRLSSYAPSGALEWSLKGDQGAGQWADVAVDTSGHPWAIATGSAGPCCGPYLWEYGNSGTPPAHIGSLPPPGSIVDVDANGNLYVGGGEIRKYVGGVLASTFAPSTSNMYIDQSSPTGHIFTVPFSGKSFTDYDSSETKVGTYGEGELSNATSIAYNPGLDRVYVYDNNQNGGQPVVAAFGPLTTGTVGDATIEAPASVGVSTAHFSGTVNPQGTNSKWRFEWRKPGEGWAESSKSPEVSLPVDSNEHAVEYTTNKLRGNTEYEVRLVAVNTENQLSGESAVKTFKTTQASQVPAVTINTPNPITVNSAKIMGTVNPQGDTAEWRVQTSKDPACASGFTDQALQTIAEGTASPVPVEYNLTGLLPAEHYCARIVATNSAGSTTSEVKEFETLDVPPTQVFTAFVAPRTDTTARLNGYVNPEGSDATYSFEYSEDGSNWTALPNQVTRHSRTQYLVGEEVTGLQPNTTYHYRFSVENGAGPVQGEEKTFTTRSSAEMQLPERGIELVNSPEKGTQNVLVPQIQGQPMPIAGSGNRAIWSTTAGAPGSTTAAVGTFLATRTPNGWQNRPLAPPAEEQVGGGNDLYGIVDANPSFNRFLEKAYVEEVLLGPAPTFVRLDDEQRQEVLNEYTEDVTNTDVYNHVDTTSDMSHVFLVNPANEHLEDVGSGTPETVSIMPDGTPNQCGLSIDGRSFVGGGAGTENGWRPGTTVLPRQTGRASTSGRCQMVSHVRALHSNTTRRFSIEIATPKKR